jgi:hypothetical protein
VGGCILQAGETLKRRDMKSINCAKTDLPACVRRSLPWSRPSTAKKAFEIQIENDSLHRQAHERNQLSANLNFVDRTVLPSNQLALIYEFRCCEI